jgi:hypothetical protein
LRRELSLGFTMNEATAIPFGGVQEIQHFQWISVLRLPSACQRLMRVLNFLAVCRM